MVTSSSTSSAQAPSNEVHVRYNDQTITFNREWLNGGGVINVEDLIGVLKPKLRKFIEKVSDKVITLHRGENEVLGSETLISGLYNTENQALHVVVDETFLINLIVKVPGKELHFHNQRISSLNDVIAFTKREESLAQFITYNTSFLGDDKQALDQQHVATARESGTLNITLSSPNTIDTGSEIHKENLEKAFNVDYVDHDGMINKFLIYLNRKHKTWNNNTNHYVPYTTIFQSSGYGKSRLIKEVAKQIPTIYLCLRDITSTGYPPRTSAGADLFERVNKDLKEGEEWRFLYILQAIIECFNEELITCGCNTQKFWDKQMDASFCEKVWTKIQGRSKNWRNILESEVNNKCDFITKNNPSDNVRFLFCIDEARALISPSKGHNISPYRLFRRALRKVKWNGFFTLLLGTLSRISNFVPPKSLDPSHRDIDDLSLELFYPYFRLTTMDALHKNNSEDEHINLAKYGRPLYMSYLQSCPNDPQAINNLMNLLKRKLLGGANHFENSRKDISSLAILSSLIGLDISPQSQLASELVASHMATCLAVSEDREQLIIVYPSEPLLSEAAFELLSTSALSQILNQFSTLLKKGIVEPDPRGEIVARIILVLVANRLRSRNNRAENNIKEFLRELYNDNSLPSFNGISQELLDGTVAFTHFNTIDYIPEKKNLKQFYMRRCAFVMKRNNPGADICIPIKLTTEEYSVILIQIKNIKDHKFDDKYPASARSMFNYGYVFKNSDLEKYNKPCVCLYWQLGFHGPGHYAQDPGQITETRRLKTDNYQTLSLFWATSGFNHFKINDDRVSKILQDILASHISPFNAEWKVNNVDEGDNWEENEIKIMHPLGYNYEGYNYESENENNE
ncbi:6655_t:CDS:2 [Diversispora eburnea]|uniref:6655_t:CDS:1 n=1 Tax=Diversispora eburnea TaxID=1213867 RepID=A0A9N8VYH6_9GLOM|nr:6655_t:CDS:2 [Diversispora eburnea]